MTEKGKVLQALTDEPWLSLRAWADMLEEEGKLDRARVVRWLIKFRRAPRQVCTVYLDGRVKFQYFWMWKSISDRDDPPHSFLRTDVLGGNSQHALPWSMGSVPRKEIYETPKEAYFEAVSCLQWWVDDLWILSPGSENA